MKKLSIIVPVYNVAAYLRKCVDSLLNQSLSTSDYEIILVDDGSSDGSGSIADEYASRFNNVRVLHQENRGLSGARNAGILHAEGNYVQFVDSDDYLEPDVLPKLIQRMDDDDLDVLRFNYRNVNENGEEVNPNKQYRPFVDYSSTVCSGIDFLVNRLGSACYACQFIIKRRLLDRCLFMEGIYYEDTEWTPRMLVIAGRASSANAICYNYLIRQGSITKITDITKKKKSIEDRLTIIKLYYGQMEKISDISWHKCMISDMVLGVLSKVSVDFYHEREDYINQLKALGVFPLSYKKSTTSGFRKKLLINISPLLFCSLLKASRHD